MIRFLAVGGNPRRYFSSGWNVFDFVVVGAAFVPGLRENATLLRLIRLLRVVRVFRVLPDLRVFVIQSRRGTATDVDVLPAALSRMAPAGSMIVNSSRGGGAKDTWVLR